MTEQELDAIEARANAATPGPYIYFDNGLGYSVATRDRAKCVARTGDIKEAGFIAHAREDIPALIAEVRRLRAIMSEAAVKIEWHDIYDALDMLMDEAGE